MIAVFVIGYLLITIEHLVKVNKATIALMTGILLWVLQFGDQVADPTTNLAIFSEHLAGIAQVVLFLLGALSVVEIINQHKGFQILTEMFAIRSKRVFLVTVAIVTFALSSVLDNLTTTIIMVTFLSKLLGKTEDRLLIGGAVVIAANAGGAWTPIGDVTTTMLWIGGQLSTFEIMRDLVIPSVVCASVSTLILTLPLKGKFNLKPAPKTHMEPFGYWVFWLGIAALIFVPIFKVVTGLPPFMGIFFGLSFLWIVTDLAHHHDERTHLRVPHVMTKIDLSAALFFLGILLAIDALEAAGILKTLALFLDRTVGHPEWIAFAIGIASAVVDNVPLVAAAMSMYDMTQFPIDDNFWKLVAYCAGTGGSVLIIGSASGVIYMGLEKVSFFWYIKRISLAALIGYAAGAFLFMALNQF